MTDLPSSPRSNAKAIAVVTIVVALVAGVMVGVVCDRVWMWRHSGRMADRAMRGMTPRILARLDSELNLTPPQHLAIARVLDQHRLRMNGIFDSVQPRIRAEIDSANGEIEKVLTAEQRVKFETLKLRVHGPGRFRRK